MCKTVVKYQYVSRALCAYEPDFLKRPGCVLIGACVLIRTNTVSPVYPIFVYLFELML